MMSFWRNRDVIISSCVQGTSFLSFNFCHESHSMGNTYMVFLNKIILVPFGPLYTVHVINEIFYIVGDALAHASGIGYTNFQHFGSDIYHKIRWTDRPNARVNIHYSDVIMGAMASQITNLTIVHRLFRRGTKKTSKLGVTGLCTGNSSVTGEFPHK